MGIEAEDLSWLFGEEALNSHEPHCYIAILFKWHHTGTTAIYLLLKTWDVKCHYVIPLRGFL